MKPMKPSKSNAPKKVKHGEPKPKVSSTEKRPMDMPLKERKEEDRRAKRRSTLSPVNVLAFLLVMAGAGVSQLASSVETVAEKGAATAKTMKRGVKKGWDRTKEITCMAGDLECAKRKAENRLKESKDYVEDKVDETRNKLD